MPTSIGAGSDKIPRLNWMRTLIQSAIDLVERMYIADLLLIASFYPEWTQIGAGLGNYMAYGDCPQNGIGDPSKFRFPQGVVTKRNLSSTLPINLADAAQIREHVEHSWYTYLEGIKDLHPLDGSTQPRYSGPSAPFDHLDEEEKYSWVKAPRWRGIPMEVGPLARILVGYASGRQEFRDVVNEALGKLGWKTSALFSTLGRRTPRVTSP